MPAWSRIEADMQGIDEADTIARQLAAFDILNRIALEMVEFRNVNGTMSAREQALWLDYGEGHNRVMAQVRTHATPLGNPFYDRVGRRAVQLTNDPSFRQPFFDRYFSAAFQARIAPLFPQSSAQAAGPDQAANPRSEGEWIGPCGLRGARDFLPWLRPPCRVAAISDEPDLLSADIEAGLSNALINTREDLGADVLIYVLPQTTAPELLRAYIDDRYRDVRDVHKLSAQAHVVVFLGADGDFLTVRAAGWARNKLIRVGLMNSAAFREVQLQAQSDGRAALLAYVDDMQAGALRSRQLNIGNLLNYFADVLSLIGVANVVDDVLGATVLSENDIYRLTLLRPALQAWLGVSDAVPNGVISLILYLCAGVVLAAGVKFAVQKAISYPRFEKKFRSGGGVRITLGDVLGVIASLLVLGPLSGAAITASLGRLEDVYEVYHLVGRPIPNAADIEAGTALFVRMPPNFFFIAGCALALALPPLNAALRWWPATRLTVGEQQAAAGRMNALQLFALQSAYLGLRGRLGLLYDAPEDEIKEAPFTSAVAASILQAIITFFQYGLAFGLLPAGLVLLAAISSARDWIEGLPGALKQARVISSEISTARMLQTLGRH